VYGLSVLWLLFADAIEGDVVSAEDGEAVAGLAEREALPVDGAAGGAGREEAMTIRDAVYGDGDVLKIGGDDAQIEIHGVQCLRDADGEDAGVCGRIRLFEQSVTRDVAVQQRFAIGSDNLVPGGGLVP
jgi:hypothetical protein